MSSVHKGILGNEIVDEIIKIAKCLTSEPVEEIRNSLKTYTKRKECWKMCQIEKESQCRKYDKQCQRR